MKLFGKLTRSMDEWHPHRMLSRRFNLPDPYPAVHVHSQGYMFRLLILTYMCSRVWLAS